MTSTSSDLALHHSNNKMWVCAWTWVANVAVQSWQVLFNKHGNYCFAYKKLQTANVVMFFVVQFFFLTLLCCIWPSCVVCDTKMSCSTCNLWSLPRDDCRVTTSVIRCKHSSGWSIHGNLQFVLARQLQSPLMWQLQFYWHGNYSCIGMATTVVPPWQLQLRWHGNYSCSGMATAVVSPWQLQVSTDGNNSCPGMANVVLNSWQL